MQNQLYDGLAVDANLLRVMQAEQYHVTERDFNRPPYVT